jgi:hypothetical protein
MIINLLTVDESVMLAMCYFVTGSSILMIAISIIRLFYDLGKGEELEKKLKEEK